MSGPERMGATRRELLIGAVLTGGALVIGGIPGIAGATEADFAAFGPFVRIAPDDSVTVVAKFSELGQGTQSGLAALVAEELDADWSKVSVESAAADVKLFARAGFGLQLTGGSGSITDSWDQLRKAGAAARAMLVSAAAAEWKVPVTEITVRDGIVRHAASGRQSGFGRLVPAAAKIAPPAEPVLKPASEYRLIGTDRVTRLDARAKSTGTARFTQDIRHPDMVFAVVAHSPRFGGTVASFDAAAARKVAGVVDVIQIPSGVAVVAKNTHAAIVGRDALTVKWNDEKAEKRSSAAIAAEYRAMAHGESPVAWAPFQQAGNAAGAFDDPARTIDIDMAAPFLAHAAMEPMNCVATVGEKGAKLSFGCQSQTTDQQTIAALLGCDPTDIEIETLPAGGSFGRRSVMAADYQKEAVEVARRMKGRPVKLVWTREDDMSGGYYRPLTHHRARIAVDAAGYPAAWEHRIVTASLMRGTPFEMMVQNGVDGTGVEGVKGSPYLDATPVVDARTFHPNTIVPVLWLRSVGATHTAMMMEHAIDQLAHRAGIDPVDYRRTMYKKAKAASHLAVLDLAAEKAGWGTPIEKGWARGVAVHECFGSTVANIAEVGMVNGEPRVRRVVVAIDCGIAVAPDQVRAQMEGGIMYGLSYTLFGDVKMEDGVVQNRNFDGYRVLRLEESPHVEVHILPSTRNPAGAGEPGTPVIGPAVANALLALTGKPTTTLPLVKA
jgi:isoquinoline 1-oxidoreductase beta subunit